MMNLYFQLESGCLTRGSAILPDLWSVVARLLFINKKKKKRVKYETLSRDLGQEKELITWKGRKQDSTSNVHHRIIPRILGSRDPRIQEESLQNPSVTVLKWVVLGPTGGRSLRPFQGICKPETTFMKTWHHYHLFPFHSKCTVEFSKGYMTHFITKDWLQK